jgi:hypothetical protein
MIDEDELILTSISLRKIDDIVLMLPKYVHFCCF